MAITAAELLYKGSNAGATIGNATANAGAGTNLGNFTTSGTLADATLNNLFPDVTGDENAASNVDYQCIFIHNNNASITLQNAVTWISAETVGGANCAIGVDPTATSAVGSATAQAVTIATKNTAPAGVAFSAPTTKGTGLSLGNIPAGNVKAIWVRRSATNSAAFNNDSVTVRVEGDTTA